MKGLILKDFFVIKEYRKIVGLFAIISIVMLAGNGNETFVLGYFSMMMISVSVGSVSYDDYNNGYSFLMSLPITRKQYVKSKYSFAIVTCSLGWLFAVIMTAVSLAARGRLNLQEWITIWCVFWAIEIFVISVTMPLAIKYGSEKGRTMMIVVIVAVFVVILGAKKLVEKTNINVDAMISKVIESGALSLVIFLGLAVVAILLSYRTSANIMAKKEF